MHVFFNNRDKVGINNIKNSCASHMLLKKETHVTFIDWLEDIPPTQFGGKLCPYLR
jgi:hypothetical protein